MTAAFDPMRQPFRLNPQYRLQYEEAQQCHVLLYPEGLVKLSDTATEILKRCEQPQTGAELVTSLQQDYPDAPGLPGDVQEFLAHAAGQEWIVPAQD